MPSSAANQALAYARQRFPQYLEELRELISIPSVSTEPERRQDVQRAAEWLAGRLRRLGFPEVRVMPTAGSPVVFAESAPIPGPTVLVYGHYDVQPVDPLNQWESDPFGAEQKGDLLFGRGASDMKGQIVAVLSALEALRAAGPFPVRIKLFLEGEEEVGSPNLETFIEEQRELLASSICLNPDAGMIDSETPTIVYGLRGIAYFELNLQGPLHDLHSGAFGGAVHNPAQVLCDLIAGMHDNEGRVTLPGYYDRVKPLEPEERKELARLALDDDFYQKQTGVPLLWGESGYSAVERIGARPTLEVNGLLSGFTGEGTKTVLPARAMAKISMRLVPDQDPEEVRSQLEAYLKEKAPKTVTWSVKSLSSGPPSISSRSSSGVLALSQALEEVWKKRPVFKREGGSVPVTALMQRILGLESALTGFALPDDNAHAPNEKLHLPTWKRGIEALIRFFYHMGSSGA